MDKAAKERLRRREIEHSASRCKNHGEMRTVSAALWMRLVLAVALIVVAVAVTNLVLARFANADANVRFGLCLVVGTLLVYVLIPNSLQEAVLSTWAVGENRRSRQNFERLEDMEELDRLVAQEESSAAESRTERTEQVERLLNRQRTRRHKAVGSLLFTVVLVLLACVLALFAIGTDLVPAVVGVALVMVVPLVGVWLIVRSAKFLAGVSRDYATSKKALR